MTAPETDAARRTELQARLDAARTERHQMEVTEWGTYPDGTVRRPSAQVGIGTPALCQRHDELTHTIILLERELAGLED